MKAKNTVKFIYEKILLPACLFFTVLTVIFTLVMSNGGSDYTAYGMTMGAVGQLFLFSVFFAASNRLFFVKSIAIVLRFVLHFISFCLGCFVTFILIGGKTIYSKYIVITAIIYIVAFGVTLLIRALRKNKSKQPYKKQF